jgi:hypothetical protein
MDGRQRAVLLPPNESTFPVNIHDSGRLGVVCLVFLRCFPQLVALVDFLSFRLYMHDLVGSAALAWIMCLTTLGG